MPNLKLTLACGDYDRTRALWDGRVSPEGIDLIYIRLTPEEIFFRMLEHNEFDISEMSFSNYLTELSGKSPRFIAIPIFPSRFFRHSCVFINRKSGITTPEALKGKRVGTPAYSVTAGVFIRGFLQHDYGVAPADMEWYVGGQEEPGREDRVQLNLPENVHVHPIPKDKTLNEMLANGEIDALISPRIPQCFWAKHTDVARLWPDYKEVEVDYYRRTKIFPIMHTVVIRKEIYDAHPWVAQSLYKAFSQAKKLCQEVMNFSAALTYMLPWSIAEYESTVSLMGEDFWSYGVEANRVTLEAMTQYSYEQGLSQKTFPVEEIFAHNTLKMTKV